MNIFDEEDDFLVGHPKDKYYEVAKTANANIVEMELDKMFRRLAVAEKMLEERGLDAEHDQMIRATIIDTDIDNRLNSIYIELVGNIVTQCE